MTGNKIWRAPLAGLASLAMVATMGVTALSASADGETKADGDYTVTLKNADGSDLSKLYVRAGDSMLDALKGETLGQNDAKGTGTFVGWYDGDDFADFTAPVNGDKTLTAKFADRTVEVMFEDDAYGYYPAGDKASKTVTVPLGDSENGIPKNLLPTDKFDGQLPAEWTVSVPGYPDQTVTDLTQAKWYAPAESGAVKVKVSEWKQNVVKVAFKSDGDSYALNSYADGIMPDGSETTAGAEGDTQLNMDVVKGESFASPLIVAEPADPKTSPERTTYSSWKTGKVETTAGEDVSTNAEVTDWTLSGKDSNYAVRFYDTSKSGNLLSAVWSYTKTSEPYKGTQFVDEPSAPTKQGYEFVGWSKNEDSVSEKYNFSLPVKAVTEVFAQFKANAAANELKVTFQDKNYKGANETMSVVVKANEALTAEQVPAWSRDGYTLAGWTDEENDRTVKWTPSQLTGEVQAGMLNGNHDVTLYPVWQAVDADDAKYALQYVTKKDAAKFSNGDEYVKTLAKVQKKYDEAKKSTVGGISASVSSQIVDELKAAWAALRFDASSVDATLDGTTSGGSAKLVYRLSTPDGRNHLMTSDENEVKALTKKMGGWNLDNTTFRAINMTGKQDKWITGVVSKEAAAADVVFEPLVKQVVRLYNAGVQEHLYTADANEISVLTKSGWSKDSTAASMFVPAQYTTSTKVSRLYNASILKHLYTSDANELKVLQTRGWSLDSDAAAFYAL